MLLLFTVAFLYSSVGHGGASGYLALMGLYHFAPDIMKPSALLMNIVVSLMAYIQYSKVSRLPWRLFLFLIAGSVPAAFFGARILIDALLYTKILAVLLLLPVLRLFGLFGKFSSTEKPFNPYTALLLGILIGFVSGLIGIGGGILLSPILLLMRWADTKVMACTSALFIFVNSAAGLIGVKGLSDVLDQRFLLWVAVALFTGLIGSYIGAQRLPPLRLRQALGVVLLFASFKLWWP